VKTIQYLIEYYRGKISKMRLSELLGMSFSVLKMLLEELEKTIKEEK